MARFNLLLSILVEDMWDCSTNSELVEAVDVVDDLWAELCTAQPHVQKRMLEALHNAHMDGMA